MQPPVDSENCNILETVHARIERQLVLLTGTEIGVLEWPWTLWWLLFNESCSLYRYQLYQFRARN